MSPETGTVHRVLRVLSCFAEKETWGLNELARTLELPRPTVHRLLNLCRPQNFVAQNAEGQYVAGVALYRLGGRLAAQMPLHRIAQPVIDAIRDATDETTLLALLVRGELQMFFTASASPSHPMRYAVEKNRLQPLSWGAAARVMLAQLPAQEIERVVQRSEPSPIDGRPLDTGELLASLAQARRDGFLQTFGQRSPDSWGIAAPFFGADGEVMGSINVTIPGFRIGSHDPARVAALVRDGAARLSAQLGAPAR